MFQEICRLCLTNKNLIPIFQDKSRCNRYSLVLSLTTGLKIDLNDGLPQLICLRCTQSVNSALHLRNESHKSLHKLKHYVKQTKNSIHDIDSVLNVCTENLKCENVGDLQNGDVDFDKNNEEYSNCELELPNLEVTVEFDRLTDENQDGVHDSNFFKAQPKSLEPGVKNEVQKGLNKKERRQIYLNLIEGHFDPKGPVKCKICNKTVNSWASFISHSKIHLGFKYVCEYCGKNFVSSTQLNRHCRSHHGMQRELTCPHCDYKALDNAQLLLHIRRFHTGERPFVCDSCGASYFSRKCLIQHIETHVSEKTIQCEKCLHMFKSRRHLARHKYTAHTSKGFTYKCPVCHQIYKNFKYIRVHLKKLHGFTTRDVQIVKIKL